MVQYGSTIVYTLKLQILVSTYFSDFMNFDTNATIHSTVFGYYAAFRKCYPSIFHRLFLIFFNNNETLLFN